MSEGEIIRKKSPYVMGIDLGTSNSVIAVRKEGKDEIITIDGEKLCPSVISVTKEGDIIVGRAAKRRVKVDPQNTVSSIKRELGSDWTKKFESLPDKDYTPTDISSMVLSKLISGAQDQKDVDLCGTPYMAVICVPANFDDLKKKATIEAAEQANIEVLELLEEPVAAAIAYGADKERDQTILIYDLGGGTFDVCILEVDSKGSGQPKYNVKAKEGIPRLGGDDFDEKIMEVAFVKIKELSGIDISDREKDQGVSVKKIGEAQQKLKEAAEQAKRELSETSTTVVSIPSLIATESGEPVNLDMEITRDEFNEWIRDLLLQTKEAVEKALGGAELTIDDIDRIVLVGGSTKVPYVKEMLKEMFGKDPWADENPDTVIARGAAIKGSNLTVPDEEGVRDGEEKIDIIVDNIVTHFLGIEASGGKFSPIIKKGEKVPFSAMKQYGTPRDNMTELTIRIYQGPEESEFVGVEGMSYLGEFVLTGIPPKPRGQEQIEVVFDIDEQNILRVSAKSSSSTKDLEIKPGKDPGKDRG